MKAKNSRLAALAVFVIAGVLGFWLYNKPQEHLQSIVATPTVSQTPSASFASPLVSPKSTPLPPQGSEMIKQQRELEKKMWNLWLATPISFYGKVVDEKGIPIPGAKVHISMHDHLYGGGTEKEMLSDKDGLFSVRGHGLGLG